MQIKKLKPHIDKRLPKAKWNFDLKDIDKILRLDPSLLLSVFAAESKTIPIHVVRETGYG